MNKLKSLVQQLNVSITPASNVDIGLVAHVFKGGELPSQHVDYLRMFGTLSHASVETIGIGGRATNSHLDVRKVYQGLIAQATESTDYLPILDLNGHRMMCVKVGSNTVWQVDVSRGFKAYDTRESLEDFLMDLLRKA